MKYAMSFCVTPEGEVDEGYDYSKLCNSSEDPMPRWWFKYTKGFWDEGLYWCIVEYDDEEISP